jgi:hypothetical protein
MSRNLDEKDDQDDLPEVGTDTDLELEEEEDGADRRLDPLRRPV